MKFRDVMKYGFFNLQASKDEYLLLTAAEGPRRDLLLRYIEVTLVLLHPILPHMTEHAYKTFFLKMVGSASSNYVSTLSDYLLPEVYDISYHTFPIALTKRYQLQDTARVQVLHRFVSFDPGVG